MSAAQFNDRTRYITEAEAKNIVNDVLIDYDQRIGSVRHVENQAELKKLTAAYNRLIGVAGIFALLKLIELIHQFAAGPVGH